ncbi:MAG: uroporphyrinogen-III C-methyltransferase [Acidimicrobiales bacterium]
MTVYLVGAGPGDTGLITRRGAEVLGMADVVVYDRLIDHSLLSLAPSTARLIDAGKRPAGATSAGDVGAGSGAARQDDINRLLIEEGTTGATVVRLKGGDPYLFGRGGEEVAALSKAGIAWEIVPGVSSALAVPAAAGIPVTQRGLSSSVTVVTGQVGDETQPGGVDWESLARAKGTLVILMGMATRAEIARRLQAGGRPADEAVAVIEWGTTPRQRVVRTTLAKLASVRLGSPSVIVVGPVSRLGREVVDTRPLRGRTVVVTRAPAQADTLSRALRTAGAHVVELPVIKFEDVAQEREALQRAADSVAEYQWVAFTSANAVERFVPLVRDLRQLASTRIAAVGRATAGALEQYQIVADLVPARSSAAGLLDEIEPAEPGGRALFVRAAGAGETLGAGLVAMGWNVDEVIAYRTVDAPAPLAEVAAALDGADVVTFASASAVTAYLRLRDTRGRPLSVPPLVACIGTSTSVAARAAGLHVSVEPSKASVDALVLAIAAHFGAMPGLPGAPGPS